MGWPCRRCQSATEEKPLKYPGLCGGLGESLLFPIKAYCIKTHQSTVALGFGAELLRCRVGERWTEVVAVDDPHRGIKLDFVCF